MNNIGRDQFILGMSVGDDGFSFASSIETAMISTKAEMQSLEETIKSVENLRPNCDKLDYALAASSGVLCGIIDIFIVGKPGESSAGNVTDKWFANRTSDFARLCGWDGKEDASPESAIRFLENKFKIPYDQRGAGDAGSIIFDLNPTNHHLKSLGHNPTLLGLFFSILDQFTNQSHFVSGGDLVSLQNADGKFELRGNSVPGKLFCGLLALAGPVGWAIAGVALVGSGLMIWKGKGDKNRLEDIFTLIGKRDVKSYELAIVELNERINRIIDESQKLNSSIEKTKSFGLDYNKMPVEQQYELGSYLNLMNSSTQLLVNPITGLQPKYDMDDLEKFMAVNKKNIDNKQRNLIVSLSNLLYKIDLDEKDKKLLWKSFKGNKKFLSTVEMSKDDFEFSIIETVSDALKHKYRTGVPERRTILV